MKTYPIIPIVILLFQVNAQSQWVVKNVSTSIETIVELKFFGDRVGLAVGIDGLILKSTDAGETWNKIDSQIDGDINDVAFISEDTVFLISNKFDNGNFEFKIHESTNGGEDWAEKFSDEGALNCVQFINSNEGLASGYDGVFRTNNGGDTWNIVFSMTENDFEFGEVRRFDMVSDSVGYAVGSGASSIGNHPFIGIILKTENGGQNWQIIKEVGGILREVDFIDEELGFISNEVHTFKTTDGGITWDTLDNIEGVVDFSLLSINSIFTVNRPDAYIPGFTTTTFAISKSIDFGESWDGEFMNGAHMETVFFMSDSVGFVAGGYSIIMKTETCGGEIRGDYPWDLFVNSVDTGHLQEFKIYPNPCTNILRLDEAGRIPNGKAGYSVLSIDGEVKNRGTIYELNHGVDVSTLPGGIYFLRIENEIDGIIGIEKFIKIKED
ncbi:MAG: T9SS type A sorting domain-containing protein [Saprospiraceae bacterium]